jgi:hypothetical protein
MDTKIVVELLHEAGYVHRDINLQILIDYGLACNNFYGHEDGIAGTAKDADFESYTRNKTIYLLSQ